MTDQKSNKKIRTISAIPPNKGVEIYYRSRLNRLIGEMVNSFDYWISAAYKKAPPRIAQDAIPANMLSKIIKSLSRRWQSKFNDEAKKLASSFTIKMMDAYDFSLESKLAKVGSLIDFTMTSQMRDVITAAIEENVALIKSIPQQYSLEVQGIVMRGYSSGRDLSQISEQLQARYKITKNRAALISRDQSNKVNSVVNRTRQIELKIEEAIWKHSGPRKEPRKDHVDANNKPYKVSQGMLISGEYIFPGEKINCGCTSESILPF
jgi:uncharacterized protein with gpF-like domain